MKIVVMTTILLISIQFAHAKTDVTKQKCDYYEQQIKKANDTLRKGYKEPTGNRLREKIRKYDDLKWKECR